MTRFKKFHGTSMKSLMALAIGVSLSIAAAPASKAAEDGLSAVQKKQVEELVQKYILEHPEIIIQAVQSMQARQEQEKKARAQAALKEYKQELEADPDTPVLGNPVGKVTVVEFFDYRCGYCKRVFPSIMKVMKDDPNVRYVFKEFPILGPESVVASRAAIAVWRTRKEKYGAFHAALMSAKGGIPEARVLKIAEGLGIDPKNLKTAMGDSAIDRILERNYRLAQNLDINGTPAFVIGGKLVPGAIDLQTMKKMIAEAGS